MARILKCRNATYRVRFITDMAARAEQLRAIPGCFKIASAGQSYRCAALRGQST
jgi:hypothetical protein